MKYRLLTNEELKELEEDFKHFLISNHIYNEEWIKLNQTNDKRVSELVELFSDIVLEKALSKIKFLEFVNTASISAFYCTKDEIVLIVISSENLNNDFTKHTFEDFKNDLNIFRTTKPYEKKREEEIFNLLNSGCSIINEERFKKIELAYTYSSKTAKN
ncbi:MAG: hypothetical protein A3K10_08410 [Bacteroidetes bacterium RIFCSPLOWO2_12_FULL_31_6]|nr:MAG: hypothetical protein A3K10_08410 [Bacteroidetes bacterium RIFCSPLOWO2_12_FULL_31_6]